MRAVLPLLAALALAAPALAETPEAEVGAVLDRFHEAAAAADGETYFSLFAPGGVFIGTDATEHWDVVSFRAYAKPHFDAGRGWTYIPRRRAVSLAPLDCRCVAIFDEILHSPAYGTTRGTGTLVLTGDGWRIVQYALSIPVPNDLAGEMTARIKAFEAAQEARETAAPAD